MKTLVVDDELVSRKKLQKILASFGECQAAENGLAAIDAVKFAIAEGEPFDLITLDIMMPDMDGISALMRIRAAEQRRVSEDPPRSRILMVSSHSNKEAVLACIKAGADNYIVKPTNRETLTEKLTAMGMDATEIV